MLRIRLPLPGDAALGPLRLSDGAVTLSCPVVFSPDPPTVEVSGTVAYRDHPLHVSTTIPADGATLTLVGRTAAVGALLPERDTSLPALATGTEVEVELQVDVAGRRVDHVGRDRGRKDDLCPR